ncbi:uncharacterized protein LOC108742390 [Agrilus planipennis]|uniref:Uncharacterized protein LOC108742390 n=1 Tax=Agrilus planipennis TaxID=224129 RepID=A0A1W4XAM7_AGRPL|nr:uncharacterized protein LOC108742390 [Agrilus planipennis]
MQIHENFKNREGCSRNSTKGNSPIEKSKKENSPQSYLSLSSCSYQQGTRTIDSIMSGESLFKVFNFEPTNNYQDSDKCACFWEHLRKYTNIKPVDCSLVRDTRELKKKKTPTVKPQKEETISLNSPDFPWEQLYEELRKRKINFDLGTTKKCGVSIFNEYEDDDTSDNLVLLSLWKPKSCKKEEKEEEHKPIRYGDEQITPVCSDVAEEEGRSVDGDISDEFMHPINRIKQAEKSEVVDETEVLITMSSQSSKHLRGDDISPCIIPEEPSETLLKMPENLNKFTDTDSLEKKIQISDKKCVMCGFLDCKCKAGKAAVEDTTESSLPKFTCEMTKHEQIMIIAKDTIVKILDFSNKSQLNDSSGYKCLQTMAEEQMKPLIQSKKIIPDEVPKRGDGMIVIKAIDDLKISSSTESSIENPHS